MTERDAREIAYEMFAEWYEYCLKNGIEPEQVVSEFGEMMLITDAELIEKVQTFLD